MAIVTRYFDVNAAGAGDGTSYANRAALFVTGTMSSIISNFNFAGADSLDCICEPGSYTQSVAMTSASFTSGVPTDPRRLMIRAAGWVPLKGFVSAAPIALFPTSGMMVINCSTAVACFSGTGQAVYWQGVYFNWSATVEMFGNSPHEFNDCFLLNSAVNGKIIGSNSFFAQNSVMQLTAVIFDTVMTNIGGTCINCRIEGNLAASSGSRRGNSCNTGVAGYFTRCTIVVPGEGITHSISNPNFPSLSVAECTMITGGSGAIFMTDTATNIQFTNVQNSFIVSPTVGVKLYDFRARIFNNRIRSATPVHSITTNFPTSPANDTAAGSDAAEFVNTATGDYRIKYGSTYWGKGIGAGDEPAPSSISMRGGFIN